jgi:hypothetical protein
MPHIAGVQTRAVRGTATFERLSPLLEMATPQLQHQRLEEEVLIA